MACSTGAFLLMLSSETVGQLASAWPKVNSLAIELGGLESVRF